jgi:hypothetical protein
MPALVPIARARLRTFLSIDPYVPGVLAASGCGTRRVCTLYPGHRLAGRETATRPVGRRRRDHDQRPAMILSRVASQSLWRVDDGRH